MIKELFDKWASVPFIVDRVRRIYTISDKDAENIKQDIKNIRSSFFFIEEDKIKIEELERKLKEGYDDYYKKSYTLTDKYAFNTCSKYETFYITGEDLYNAFKAGYEAAGEEKND
jgi:hypothetical protein